MRVNPMNVFRSTGYKWTYSISHPIKWMRSKIEQAKWAVQRITHGFADVDVWNVDIWFTTVFPDMLEKLADMTEAYPGTEEFPTYFSWVIWLREKARQLRTYDDCDDQEEFNIAMSEIAKHMSKLWW